MIFLEDLGLDKTKKVGITSLLSNITQKPGSHKGGWARLLKCQLNNLGISNVSILNNKNSLDEFDYIIFDLGAEYSGTLNLFGGLDEKCWNRVCELFKFEGKLFSWRNDLPDLVGCIKSRALNKSTHQMFVTISLESLTDLENKLRKTIKFDHVYKTNKLLIGDSHAPSVWTPEFGIIERRDGRTLKGMLEHETIQRYIRTMPYITELTVHCSSIDIRHHLAREEDPELETTRLAENLVRSISTLGLNKVTLVSTVGIEDESRKLPATGFFKGSSFYGSWEKRNLLRNIFNYTLEQVGSEYGYEVLKFPEYFFDETGKMKMEYLEIPKSVHLSPEYYKWDLDKNVKRW